MSNAQTWADAIAPIQARDKENVMQATFGHLAPIKNISYKGVILFTKSAYCSGTIYLIDSKFSELSDSPWLYDFIHEQLYKFATLEEGAVYQLNCTFRNYRIYGKPILLHKLN